MKVAVMGCGAMGTIIGAYLTKGGIDVDMIDNYKAHVDAMNEKGAHIVDHVDMVVPVHALTPDQMEGYYDIVFLLTKQTANEAVAKSLLPHLKEDSVVVAMQNGVPEPFVDRLIGGNRTIGATMLFGATFVEPGVSAQTMSFTPGYPLFDIGEMNGLITERVEKVHEVLNHMGPNLIVTNLMEARWNKLVVNACGSGMSAALYSVFGPIIDDPRALDILTFLGHECALCAEAEGFKLSGKWAYSNLNVPGNYEKSKAAFFSNYDFQRGAEASMLQDLKKNQLSEVRMINGYVCETGDKHGIDTPYNDMIVEIVEGIGTGKYPRSFENLKLFPNIDYRK